jgi:MOSC domain-containing protein YiiM
MKGRLVQLNVSRGGMPKQPVLQAHVGAAGVEGDRQLNKKYHGGPDRAVCLFSTELYDRLRSFDINLPPGSVGENFTTSGMDLQKLQPGDRLKVGGCIIEITKVRVPCSSLKKWDVDLPELIVGYSGWVARVIQEGLVRPGDLIEGPVMPDSSVAKAPSG